MVLRKLTSVFICDDCIYNSGSIAIRLLCITKEDQSEKRIDRSTVNHWSGILVLTNFALIVSVLNRRCSLFNRIILSVNTQVPRCAEVEARKWITEPGRVIIPRACVCIA